MLEQIDMPKTAVTGGVAAPCRTSPEHRDDDLLVAGIVAVVAEEFGLSEREMMARGRSHEVWKPRMAAMYLARVLTDLSLPELGQMFRRNHTTVLRAFRRCREMMACDELWARRMTRLQIDLVRMANGRRS